VTRRMRGSEHFCSSSQALSHRRGALMLSIVLALFAGLVFNKIPVCTVLLAQAEDILGSDGKINVTHQDTHGLRSRTVLHDGGLAFSSHALRNASRELLAKLAEMRQQGQQEQEARRKAAEEEAERARQEKEEAEHLQKKEKEALEQLASEEEAAITRLRRKLKRPLNRFEERRVRNRIRSQFGDKLGIAEKSIGDWPAPMQPQVKGQLDDSVKFFSETMRVPAVLLASSALGSLFLAPWAMDDDRTVSANMRLCKRACTFLTAATFCQMLTAVFVTANAHAKLLELGRAELTLEPTAMDMIMAHIEFEYLTCHLSFIGGVMSFVLATLCRVLAVFRFSKALESRHDPQFGLAVAILMSAVLFWWLHLANSRLIEFNNLGEMAWRYIQLLWARMRLGEIGFCGGVAIALFGISIVQFVNAMRSPMVATSRTLPQKAA